jgi:hypothetical protein
MDDNKVAIRIEDLMAKFRTFGEGLDGIREEMNIRFTTLEKKVDKLEYKLDAHIEQNHQEHKQLMQMVKEIDKEVQVDIKRAK